MSSGGDGAESAEAVEAARRREATVRHYRAERDAALAR